MATLALVLLVRGTDGSYGDAGLVVAAYSSSVAIGMVLAGRQVDRRGARPVLRLRLVLYSLLFSLVAVLALAHAPLPALVVASALAGMAQAPIHAVLRSTWPRVAGTDDASTAYAIDSALQETTWVAGPALVAVIAAFSPAAAVIGVAALAFVSTLALSNVPAVAALGPGGARSRRSPFTTAGVRTVLLACALWGTGWACLQIAMPAFADTQGNRAYAGIPLAAYAAGSLIGGLLAALRPLGDRLSRLLTAWFVYAAVTGLPLLATSLASMTVFMFLAGLPSAPTNAGMASLLGRVASADSLAEAFAWFSTSFALGVAAGNALSGWIIDFAGWRPAAALAVILTALAGVVTLLRRSTLAPAPEVVPA
jgi:MFS family permease